MMPTETQQWMKDAAIEWLSPVVKKRPTIAELEEILSHEDEGVIEVQADGSISAVPLSAHVERLAQIIAAHAPQEQRISPEHVKLTELLCSELAIRSPRVMMLRGGNDITSSGPDAEVVIQTLRGFVRQLPAPPVAETPAKPEKSAQKVCVTDELTVCLRCGVKAWQCPKPLDSGLPGWKFANCSCGGQMVSNPRQG